MTDKPASSIERVEAQYECLGCQMVAFFTPLAISGYLIRNAFFNKDYIKKHITQQGFATPGLQIANRVLIGVGVPIMICSFVYSKLFTMPVYTKYRDFSAYKELLNTDIQELPRKFAEEVVTDGTAIKEGAVKLFSKVRAASKEDNSFRGKYWYREITTLRTEDHSATSPSLPRNTSSADDNTTQV